MTTPLRFLAPVLVALAILTATPAHALDPNATPSPVIETPLPTTHGVVRVAFDAPPGKAWGMRTFAREADRLLPGVRIFTHGTCAAHPRATCVRVFTGKWGDPEQRHIAGTEGWGAVTIYRSSRVREVWLNEQTPRAKRYAAAVHEFGHILGLNHHAMHGVCGGWSDETRLSRPEVRALRAAYPAK